MNIENENDILSKIPLDMPAGPYLLGYAQAVHDLNKDWDIFRREAAKDFVAALVSSGNGLNPRNIAYSIEMADELIKQLREDKK